MPAIAPDGTSLGDGVNFPTGGSRNGWFQKPGGLSGLAGLLGPALGGLSGERPGGPFGGSDRGIYGAMADRGIAPWDMGRVTGGGFMPKQVGGIAGGPNLSGIYGGPMGNYRDPFAGRNPFHDSSIAEMRPGPGEGPVQGWSPPSGWTPPVGTDWMPPSSALDRPGGGPTGTILGGPALPRPTGPAPSVMETPGGVGPGPMTMGPGSAPGSMGPGSAAPASPPPTYGPWAGTGAGQRFATQGLNRLRAGGLNRLLR